MNSHRAEFCHPNVVRRTRENTIFVPTHHKNLQRMERSALRVLVLGAGQVGAWVARGLVERGCHVTATTTNATTTRALQCLEVEVLPWRWEVGGTWEALVSCHAKVWCVTVPPRQGAEDAVAFHRELHAAAKRSGVVRLIWTSSTAVYDPSPNRRHHRSRRGSPLVETHRGGHAGP